MRMRFHDMTVAHLLDRIRRYEYVEFMDNF
jgi:hypothetical protein